MRIKNILNSFADFTFDDLIMNEQNFEDYKSKYLDIYDKVRNNLDKEKVSILDDVDFELELIHRDEINVAYIIRLLGKLKNATAEEQVKQRKQISDLLSSEAQLRSKKELIEKFIDQNLLNLPDDTPINEAFDNYWNEEQQKAFKKLCQEEGLSPNKLEKIIGNYLFTERKPLNEEVVDTLKVKPKILKRKSIVERVTNKILSFVETFMNGV